MHENLELSPKQLSVPGAGGVAINVWDHGGNGPDLLLAHCTGTHARIWDPLVPALLPHFHVYASDTRGHGDSGTPEDYDDFKWGLSGSDLLGVVEALGLEPGIRGMGHSAGAAHICYAERERPGTFSKAVLIDAIIGPAITMQGPNPLAALSRRRKNDFPSREAAKERFGSKPPLGTWTPETLEAYVQYGFRELDDGSITLKCPGPVEAEVYERSGATDVFEDLAALEIEVTLVTSDGSDVRGMVELQKERFQNPDFRVIRGASHFIPQEQPELIVELAIAGLV